MGPLQLTVTWYEIHHTEEQFHWQSRFVLDAPVRSFLSSMMDVVPCSRPLTAKAHSLKHTIMKCLIRSTSEMSLCTSLGLNSIFYDSKSLLSSALASKSAVFRGWWGQEIFQKLSCWFFKWFLTMVPWTLDVC